MNNGVFSSVAGNPIDLTNCIPVSTNELENSSSISVFPNPVSDGILNIETNEIIDNIQVINVHGQVLKNTQNVTRSINVEHLDSGVYFLRFYAKKQNQFIKIIII